MIRSLIFLLWDYLPPASIREFAHWIECRNSLGCFHFYESRMWSAYATASALERAFMDIRYPFYVSLAKSAVLAILTREARHEGWTP